MTDLEPKQEKETSQQHDERLLEKVFTDKHIRLGMKKTSRQITLKTSDGKDSSVVMPAWIITIDNEELSAFDKSFTKMNAILLRMRNVNRSHCLTKGQRKRANKKRDNR